MYGKFFSSTFTGSLFGAGPHVFALWGYVIAHAVEGSVELNPILIAATLGTTPGEIETALALLTSPDPRSRSQAEAGRRLVIEGGYQYRVVNHLVYRSLRNEDERRAYNREAQRRARARRPVSSRVIPAVNDMSALSAHTEAEAEAETKPQIKTVVRRAPRADDPPGFAACWATYPNHRGRHAARKAWAALAPTGELMAVITAALGWQRQQPQWTKDRGQYVPMLATWLHQRRWEDELVDAPASAAHERIAAWRDECQTMHGGTCATAYLHDARRSG